MHGLHSLHPSTSRVENSAKGGCYGVSLFTQSPTFKNSTNISTFFAYSFFIEGTTEKMLQFIMPIKSIYNKMLGFKHYRDVQTIKNLRIDILVEKFFMATFLELPQ
jgi:hypothetical protein